MKRREFITLLGGAAAWPLAARAQPPERMRRIAWFGLGRGDVPSPYLDALRSGLRERGDLPVQFATKFQLAII